MSTERDKQLYDTLRRTAELMEHIHPVEGEEYTLEAILAEYGSGAAEPAQKQPEPPKEETTDTEVVRTFHPREKKKKEDKEDTVRLPLLRRKKGAAAVEMPTPAPVVPEVEETDDPTPPDRIWLGDVMRQTVDEALSERDDAVLDAPKPLGRRLRDMFRRKKPLISEDTEQLFEVPEEKPKKDLPPEPDADSVARLWKRQAKHCRLGTVWGAIPLAIAVVATVGDEFSLLPEIWEQNAYLRGGVWAGCIVLMLLTCMDVVKQAVSGAKRGHIGCEFAAVLGAVVALVNSVLVMTGAESAVMCACVCLSIYLCQLGLSFRAAAKREAYRLANGGVPPHSATSTKAGACSQKGRRDGFYRLSEEEDLAHRAEKFLVPLLVSGTAILSALVALDGAGMERFPEIWSMMLCAGVPMAMPLHYAFGAKGLQKRLAKSGVALAGYGGARTLAKSRRMILTEDDIFPPGTVEFNGYKVYGEERRKMLSYAAGVARAAKSRLYPLFAQQLSNEGGAEKTVDQLTFLEDGGVQCTIRGETVLMGSMYFMEKRHISLPRDLKLQTGVFLAIDGVLGAIFVIKYQPSRNVEWALRTLKHSRITPVLAVRSTNVTPGLLKRKFGVDAKMVYPNVATRLALSDVCDQTAQKPCALLYREGLMPLVESVVGAKKLLRGMRRGLLCALIAALAGILLTYYFTSVGAFSVLTPLYMLVFCLLCLLPTVLIGLESRQF